MVGFPGESPEEFASSLAFVEELGFAKAHVFAYSRRPGTVADRAPDQIPAPVKEERSARMLAAAAKNQLAFYQAQVGKREPVLFEEAAGPGLYQGYTANYTPVQVRCKKDLTGEILDVEITEARETGCAGQLL